MRKGYYSQIKSTPNQLLRYWQPTHRVNMCC